MKILVADDEPTSRLIAQTALHRLGHECHCVTDGAQAWEALRSWGPDAVISDWMMPGLTGIELCRAIRANPTDSYVYFVLISGQGDLDQVLEGMNAGVDDYLVKPIDTDDLQARLVAAARITSLYRDLAHQQSALEERNNELAAVARRDPLTGVGNRRALDEDIALLEARANRYGHRYCIALVDVDHFKSYNDTYGHQAGDHVLQAVAAELSGHARAGDALYRYGGDEFLCIFPEQSLDAGTLAVERMRTGLARLAMAHADNALGVITFSAGIAVLDPNHSRPAGDVLTQADEALYRAKQLGRNRVERVVPQPDGSPGPDKADRKRTTSESVGQSE